VAAEWRKHARETMPQPNKVEVVVEFAREFVRKRRAQMALRRRRIVIPALEEPEAGEFFLGEIGETEDDGSRDG
jgi:hypothetical protein